MSKPWQLRHETNSAQWQVVFVKENGYERIEAFCFNEQRAQWFVDLANMFTEGGDEDE